MNNEIKVYFIRHGKVDLPYKDHLEMPYEVLDDLATSRLDPSIVENSKGLFLQEIKSLPLGEIDVIYFNSSGFQSKRSKESALLIRQILKEKYNKEVPIFGDPNLKEIDFNLNDILPKEIFLERGMPAIRETLHNAIINQGPVEQIEHIYHRTKSVFNNLKRHEENNETVLLVSHDFYMRTVEVYLKKTRDPAKVSISDLDETSLNTYFKGFGTSYDLRNFKRF